MRRLFYEFMVDAIEEIEPNQWRVVGRCGDIPIRIGDRFDRVFCYKPRQYPEESGCPPVREITKKIGMSVLRIHAYQRSLPELGQGMTGLLVIEGEGADLIQPDWILGSVDEVTPRFLERLNPAENPALAQEIHSVSLGSIAESGPFTPVEQVGE